MAYELFFVDSIFNSEDNTSIVLLQSAIKKEQFITRSLSREQMRMYNHPGTIKEGWYVYYNNTEPKIPFGYGNLDKYARERFREYYELRYALTNRYIEIDNETTLMSHFDTSCANVVSYHINVGHGNCSIVLIESDCRYQLWMVDCSINDKTDHNRDYRANLDSAFKAILKRLGKHEEEQLHIDRFFLTHIHHDHYNGIDYLVNNHYIDNRTICYMNLYYQMASPTFNNTLRALKNANVRFIEPVFFNSTKTIRFLHPECRIYRSRSTIKNTATKYRIVSSPVNDSSAVVQFELGGKSMVFPGDLEQNGFKNMSGATTCSPCLFRSNYYIISHHGSINGHPTMPCNHPQPPIQSPIICMTQHKKKVFLMGRDRAYTGIYNPMVINYWKNKSNILEITEYAPHYLELDWGTGNVTSY